MKRILLTLLLLVVPSFGQNILTPILFQNAGFANGFSFRRSITIQSGQITGTLTNYVFTMSGTFSYLATVANGGKVQNSNGYDIIFTSDSAGSTKLNWDIILYTATTGVSEFKVLLPSAANGTVFYMFYGNPAISTIQTTTTSTYPTTFKAMWPLASNGPGPSFINKADRTSNANDLVFGFNTQTSAAAEFDGGFYTGTGSAFQTANPPNASLQITGTTITVGCWVKTTTSANNRPLIAHWSVQTAWVLAFFPTNNFLFELGQAGNPLVEDTRAAYNDGVFHQVVGAYDGAHALIYVDGFKTTGSASSANIPSATDAVAIGAYSGGSQNIVDATLDDCWVADTFLGDAWIAASFKNGAQGTFYAIGAQSP